jgi:PAS domain S-box-containing protein
MNLSAPSEDEERRPSPASTSGAPMKLLLCAVSHEGADAVARESEGSWRLLAAADPTEAMRLMDVRCPSVIVIDGPSSDAVVRSCRTIRAARKCRDAVIIAFAGDGPEEIGVLLEAGADDVFVRSSGDAVLRSRLQVASRTATTLASRRMDEDASEQFFRLSIQLLCIVIGDYFSLVNPAWTQVLGWSSEELTSTPWIEFVHPDDLVATMAARSVLLADLPLGVFTNRYRRKDGAYRWLEWRATLSMERDIIYAVVHDVTEARETKEALRELSERLATTLDSIGDGVISTDLSGAVVGMNPMAERLTEWTLAEATARRASVHEILPLVNGDTRASVESPIDHALRDGVVVFLEKNTLLTRRDGSAIPIADSCAPIRMHDGTVNGAVMVFRDLTAQKSAEAVQTLVHKQMVFADRMAAVGTLAAGVAHEINNPLSFVVANVSTALEQIRAMSGPLSAPLLELQKMLVDARAGAERVTKIVRGLKTFSRSDEERPHLVDLVPVLELSIGMAVNQIRQSASLVTEFGAVPLVEADDAQLGQVFVNLLMNAAQAFPDGNEKGNEIHVVTSTDAEGRAVVEVKDTGSGIPPALLGRIFDPFFTTKPIGSGTGLGLSITHNIVTGMGGDISVESVLGKGTSFRLVLPPSRSSATPAPEVSGSTESASTRRGAILVVDDEPDVCVAIGRVLGQHDVTIANDARTALELMATGKVFDLVLSDLMMPNMSGMALFRAILEQYPALAARVVFITGGAFTPEAHAFLDSVSNERLAKPFNSEQLRITVRRFVG